MLYGLYASQSAFVRGFIDDSSDKWTDYLPELGLNPRSCAASSMTHDADGSGDAPCVSQSAFVRGFIDDRSGVDDANES